MPIRPFVDSQLGSRGEPSAIRFAVFPSAVSVSGVQELSLLPRPVFMVNRFAEFLLGGMLAIYCHSAPVWEGTLSFLRKNQWIFKKL